MDQNRSYSIDLGGTQLRAAEVDIASGTVQRSLRIATPAGPPDVIVDAMTGLLKKLGFGVADAGDPQPSLGVAAPGPLDARQGMLFDVPNLPGWAGYPLAGRLQERLSARVYVHNDASLAGLAEARFGAGTGFDPLLYVTYSTGIGGGIVSNGRIWGGANGLAGEIGHLVVRDGGPACNLGHPGCAEGIAAGISIARRVRDRDLDLEHEESTSLAARAPGLEMDAATLADLADAGDAAAIDIYREAGRALGLAVAGGINLIDPARVVIGGGVSQAWRHFETTMHEAVASTVLAFDARDLDIVPSALGDDAGLIGAALHAASETARESSP